MARLDVSVSTAAYPELASDLSFVELAADDVVLSQAGSASEDSRVELKAVREAAPVSTALKDAIEAVPRNRSQLHRASTARLKAVGEATRRRIFKADHDSARRVRSQLIRKRLTVLRDELEKEDAEAGEVNIYGIALIQASISRNRWVVFRWILFALVVVLLEIVGLQSIAFGTGFHKCV